MKTIIAGSRTVTDKDLVFQILDQIPFKITEVISGWAPGVDRFGVEWAREKKIPFRIMKANWQLYGLRAGYRRNREMAEVGEALVAIWNGRSSGTRHMIQIMRERSSTRAVYIYNTTLKEGSLSNVQDLS